MPDQALVQVGFVIRRQMRAYLGIRANTARTPELKRMTAEKLGIELLPGRKASHYQIRDALRALGFDGQPEKFDPAKLLHEAKEKFDREMAATPFATDLPRLDYLSQLKACIAKSPKPKKMPSLPRGPEFYKTDEWREVRYRALKLHGACCQCCGARPSIGKPLHVDHIKPRSKYPELELELSNLQILCEDCNLGKGAWDDTDWRSSAHAQTGPVDDFN